MKVPKKVSQFVLREVEQLGSKAKGAAKDVGKAAEDAPEYDPYAVRRVLPMAKPSLEESASTTPSSLIQPATREDLARLLSQERTGIFDYDFRMPYRPSGVQRYQPRGGVPQRSQDLLGRRDVFQGMVEGVQRGRELTGDQDWYEAGPVYKSFIDEFGPEEGNLRFDAFMNAVAATSPRSDVGTNLRNATYWYGQAFPERPPGSNFAPITEFPEEIPYPYGHLAQNLHRANAEKTLLEGGAGFSERKNPKPLSFAWNFKGDPNLVTVDTHAFRAPAMLGRDSRFLETSFLNEKGATPRNIMREHEQGLVSMDEAAGRGPFWQSKPRENEYAAWEDYYRRIAAELGITPRAAQGFGWVGHGPMTGLESAPKPFMDFVEERVLKTARERNMDPRDVWREAIRGIRPLTFLEDQYRPDAQGTSAIG